VEVGAVAVASPAELVLLARALVGNLRKRSELGLTAKTFRQGRGGFAATLDGQEERK
jgi:hypothetical protein